MTSVQYKIKTNRAPSNEAPFVDQIPIHMTPMYDPWILTSYHTKKTLYSKSSFYYWYMNPRYKNKKPLNEWYLRAL